MGCGLFVSLIPSFHVGAPHQIKGFVMASLQQMAEDIIEKRGGDAYKRAWLERWLSDPDNESEYLSLLLKKELNEAIKKKKDTSKPKKINL